MCLSSIFKHLKCVRRTLNLPIFEAPAGQFVLRCQGLLTPDCLLSCSSSRYLPLLNISVCLSFPQYFSVQQTTSQHGSYSRLCETTKCACSRPPLDLFSFKRSQTASRRIKYFELSTCAALHPLPPVLFFQYILRVSLRKCIWQIRTIGNTRDEK